MPCQTHLDHRQIESVRDGSGRAVSHRHTQIHVDRARELIESTDGDALHGRAQLSRRSVNNVAP